MAGIETDSKIGVVGAGTMGAGIAQVAAQAGHEVLIYDALDGAAEKGLRGVAKGLDRLVERGKIDTARRDEIMGCLIPVADIKDLAPAAMVIEAIVERLDVKQELFAKLEDICGADVILATNTSSLSVTEIGAGLARPERFVGVHFFNPAAIMKLVEIVSGTATAPEIAATALATATAWGKQAVHAKSTPGFIVNRVARPYYAEALRVLEEGGADVATIDAALREAGGFRMGPFALMDLIGNDVNFAVTKSVYQAFYWDDRFKPSQIQEDLVAGGRLGRKSGRGFYDYAEDAAEMAPHNAVEGTKPQHAIAHVHMGVAAPLAAMAEAAGIEGEQGSSDTPPNSIVVDGVTLMLTDGAGATAQAARHGLEELVMFDLALDYEAAKRIVVAPADQASDKALATACGFFQALGKEVSVIDDVPGLIVMRTVAMLANLGADTVASGVCEAEAVDIAMCNGVNYPLGPLAWATRIGLGHIETVLDNLAGIYGETRYRCAPLLRRKALTKAGFYEDAGR